MNKNVIRFGSRPPEDTSADYAALVRVERAAEHLLHASEALLALALGADEPVVSDGAEPTETLA